MSNFNLQGKGLRLWFRVEGKRSSIYFAEKLSKNEQTRISSLVDELERCKKMGLPLTEQIQSRVNEIRGSWLSGQLVKKGLLLPQQELALGAFLDELIAKRDDLAKSTLDKWKNASRSLVEFFGGTKDMSQITVGDAEDFRLSLQKTELAEATISKRLRLARQFFADALKHEQIRKNPFVDLKTGSESNDSRRHYVQTSDIDKVLNAAPSADWRVIISLWRYGGLRKGEVLLLNWSDILWEQNKIRVSSPKTSRYGKPERIIPLWPEVRGYLDELHDLAKPGQKRVITRYKSGQNLYTEFARIVERSGVEKWPRLIQNLRSSAQNDLEIAGHRPSVVAAWIGNSESIARRHYLGVIDADFEVAEQKSPFASIVQHVVQHSAASTCTEGEVSSQEQKKSHLQVTARWCRSMQVAQMPPQGLEP